MPSFRRFPQVNLTLGHRYRATAGGYSRVSYGHHNQVNQSEGASAFGVTDKGMSDRA
jgi:hypothetical protein